MTAAQDIAARPRSLPGAALVHPSAALAAGVILFNDLWLRPRHPGFLSGKLSDAGICFLLPVLLVATCEWLAFVAGALLRWLGLMPETASAPPAKPPRRASPAHSGLGLPLVATAVAAAAFTALELWPAAGRLHAVVIRAVAGSAALPLTRDPTDLACLSFTVVACLHLCRVQRRRTGTTPRGLR